MGQWGRDRPPKTSKWACLSCPQATLMFPAVFSVVILSAVPRQPCDDQDFVCFVPCGFCLFCPLLCLSAWSSARHTEGAR